LEGLVVGTGRAIARLGRVVAVVPLRLRLGAVLVPALVVAATVLARTGGRAGRWCAEAALVVVLAAVLLVLAPLLLRGLAVLAVVVVLVVSGAVAHD
jgi:hypothetical protein